MKFTKIIALSLIACASLSSCLKSEFRYNGLFTFADVIDEKNLNCDGDMAVVITEDATDSKFTLVESKRVAINCDLLDLGTPRSIKLNAYQGVDVKPCLSSGDIAAPGIVEHRDSVYVMNKYLTANGKNWYVSFILSIPAKKDSNVEHDFNLIFDKESTSQSVKFTLYHNAGGEVVTTENKADKDWTNKVLYLSFPIKSLIESIWNSNTQVSIESAFELKDKDKKDGE